MSRCDAAARLRDAVDHVADRWHEELQKGFVRQHEDAIVRGLAKLSEEIGRTLRGGQGIGAPGGIAHGGLAQRGKIAGQASACGGFGNRWLEHRECLPNIECRDIVQCACPPDPVCDKTMLGTRDHHELRAALTPQQPGALELAQSFAHGRTVDAEAPREL